LECQPGQDRRTWKAGAWWHCPQPASPDRRAGVAKIEAAGMAFAVEESMRNGYPVELRVEIVRFEQKPSAMARYS
jgi:hypothetical protein